MASTNIIREPKIRTDFFYGKKLEIYKDFYEQVLGPSSFSNIIGRKERCQKFIRWAGIMKDIKFFKIMPSEEIIKREDLTEKDLIYLVKQYFKDIAG